MLRTKKKKNYFSNGLSGKTVVHFECSILPSLHISGLCRSIYDPSTRISLGFRSVFFFFLTQNSDHAEVKFIQDKINKLKLEQHTLR